ncbi:MAG: uroporphyrinogen-III synthase [Bacteroidota bacterium]
MAANNVATAPQEQYKTIKTILVSQPKPERSPYYDLEKKYGLTIDWRPFIHVEGLTAKEFRKQRVRPDEYTAIIFTSKNAIEHFFRICEEMRITMSQDTKYFCLSEAIANYLQKFIVYRKRKVFVGKRKVQDLNNAFMKHKAKEKFLLPCSN